MPSPTVVGVRGVRERPSVAISNCCGCAGGESGRGHLLPSTTVVGVRGVRERPSVAISNCCGCAGGESGRGHLLPSPTVVGVRGVRERPSVAISNCCGCAGGESGRGHLLPSPTVVGVQAGSQGEATCCHLQLLWVCRRGVRERPPVAISNCCGCAGSQGEAICCHLQLLWVCRRGVRERPPVAISNCCGCAGGESGRGHLLPSPTVVGVQAGSQGEATCCHLQLLWVCRRGVRERPPVAISNCCGCAGGESGRGHLLPSPTVVGVQAGSQGEATCCHLQLLWVCRRGVRERPPVAISNCCGCAGGESGRGHLLPSPTVVGVRGVRERPPVAIYNCCGCAGGESGRGHLLPSPTVVGVRGVRERPPVAISNCCGCAGSQGEATCCHLQLLWVCGESGRGHLLPSPTVVGVRGVRERPPVAISNCCGCAGGESGRGHLLPSPTVVGVRGARERPPVAISNCCGCAGSQGEATCCHLQLLWVCRRGVRERPPVAISNCCGCAGGESGRGHLLPSPTVVGVRGVRERPPVAISNCCGCAGSQGEATCCHLQLLWVCGESGRGHLLPSTTVVGVRGVRERPPVAISNCCGCAGGESGRGHLLPSPTVVGVQAGSQGEATCCHLQLLWVCGEPGRGHLLPSPTVVGVRGVRERPPVAISNCCGCAGGESGRGHLLPSPTVVGVQAGSQGEATCCHLQLLWVCGESGRGHLLPSPTVVGVRGVRERPPVAISNCCGCAGSQGEATCCHLQLLWVCGEPGRGHLLPSPTVVGVRGARERPPVAISNCCGCAGSQGEATCCHLQLLWVCGESGRGHLLPSTTVVGVRGVRERPPVAISNCCGCAGSQGEATCCHLQTQQPKNGGRPASFKQLWFRGTLRHNPTLNFLNDH